MKNNLEKHLIKNSQLLQASLTLQWAFAILGLNLPPTLTGGTEGCLQSRQIKLVWFCFCMHSFVLLLAVIYLVYINNVYVNLVVENYDLDSITNVLSISINITVAFVQFVMQLVVFVKQKSYKQLIHRIAQLERDLLLYYGEYEWLQNDINLSLNFRQRCVQFRQYILWRYGLFMLAFISFVSYINYHLVAEMMDFKDQLLTIYLTSALQVKALEFCLFARIVDEFITALHNFLKCLKYEIAKTDGKCYMSLLFHRKLMTNQFLINRIWLLVRHIEENFAVPMLVLFLYNGIAITHTINWSYVISFDYSTPDYFLKFYSIYVFLVFFLMFIPCWFTQLCIDKYKQFGSTLHNIKFNDDFILNHQIREFSLQLHHQEMLFTCAGFFDINLKYFGLMVLSISTYVAILIQFKLQKETEKANVRL